MFVNHASVAAAMVLSLIGTSPSEPRAGSRPGATRSLGRLAAASKLWAPKKSRSKSGRSEDEGDTAKEEELLLGPPVPTRAAITTRPRRGGKSSHAAPSHEDAEAQDSGQRSGQDNGEDSPQNSGEDDDHPKVTRRHESDAEEDDDEDDDAPLPSLAVVRPRLVAFEIGALALGRNFHYDTALQGDSVFPRVGYRFALEAFPLLRTSGFQRKLGLGLVYERETGTASTSQMADGSTVSYPMTQGHWGFDLRYAFPVGGTIVLLPALGYGRAFADLGRRTPIVPSMCVAAANQAPCFADTSPSFISIDMHLRLAVTPELGLTLVAGYLLGVGVGKGPDQISAEGSASVQGFHADVGASVLLRDWFALSATVPIRYYGYSLSPTAGGAATYRSASDLTYGLVAGIAVLAP